MCPRRNIPHAEKNDNKSAPFSDKHFAALPVNEAEARYRVIELAKAHPGVLTNLLFALQDSGADWVTTLERLRQAVAEKPSLEAQQPACGDPSRKCRTRRTMTAEEFAAAVEGLIAEARAKGLPDESLLSVINDIERLLRRAIDNQRRS